MTAIPSPTRDLPVTAHFFWAYGALSRLECLSTASFVAQGYEVRLWTYGDLPNAPAGVVVCDAREVLPESAVFLNRAGSYASFSDYFRYAILARQGGLYADTDVIALKPASALAPVPFLVTERGVWHSRFERAARWLLSRPIKFPVNNNVIYSPQPEPGNLIDLALAVTERYPKDRIEWGEIGPNLLTALVQLTPAHGFIVHPPTFANSLAWWESPATTLLAPAPLRIPPDAHFLHCFNESWRQAGVDKSKPFPVDSPLGRFAKQFGLA
jgi:hypothetical protein